MDGRAGLHSPPRCSVHLMMPRIDWRGDSKRRRSLRRHRCAGSMDPPYLQALKGEMPIMKMGWFKSYKAAFIDAHKFRPVVHVITGIMCLGYTLEYFHHLRRERSPARPCAHHLGRIPAWVAARGWQHASPRCGYLLAVGTAAAP